MNELILFLLFTKHFLIDFPLQTPYQWMNKGRYGHPGGLLHSFLHSAATLLIFLFFTTPLLAILLALADGVIHYHIDWAKMNINSYFKLTPQNPAFWTLLGIDQYLHAITYLALVYVL